MVAGNKNQHNSESLKSPDFKLSAFSPSLRIGYDGKRAAQNFTGLGNYSRYLINLLASQFPKNQYLVYLAKALDNSRLENLLNNSAVSFRIARPRFFKSLWRSFGMVKDLEKDHIDLYHGLSNEIPFGIKSAGIPSVVTIHDLIFLRFPGYYPWFDRKVYELKFSYACRNADRIIAISEQTKKDIIAYFSIDPDKIEVIYQDCDPVFKIPVSNQEKIRIRSVYQLPEKYILNVGTIESRKNLLLIVEALKVIPQDISLVVVGRETSYTQKVKDYITANNLQNRVHFLKGVAFSDLPAIYQQAQVFVYPSKFEGFGIPIVEALHSGVPVIAATGSCLEEAGGPGSLYVNPENSSDLCSALELVLNDQDKKSKMIESGLEYVKRFSEDIIAEQVLNVYKQVLAHAKN